MIVFKKTVSFRSMGVDLSTSATGVVVLEESGVAVPKLVLQDELKSKKTGFQKYRELCEALLATIHLYEPDRLVLEGYSLNMKNSSSVIPLVEIGGILRFLMNLDGIKWYDPRATELKKFVCGTGNANKDQVMMQTFKRWGFEAPTNNIADAYVLACMGLAHANRLPSITLEMRKVVGNLKVCS